jgi:hypothetical protein
MYVDYVLSQILVETKQKPKEFIECDGTRGLSRRHLEIWRWNLPSGYVKIAIEHGHL